MGNCFLEKNYVIPFLFPSYAYHLEIPESWWVEDWILLNPVEFVVFFNARLRTEGEQNKSEWKRHRTRQTTPNNRRGTGGETTTTEGGDFSSPLRYKEWNCVHSPLWPPHNWQYLHRSRRGRSWGACRRSSRAAWRWDGLGVEHRREQKESLKNYWKTREIEKRKGKIHSHEVIEDAAVDLQRILVRGGVASSLQQELDVREMIGMRRVQGDVEGDEVDDWREGGGI